MRPPSKLIAVGVLCAALITCSCATYKITRELEKPIDREGNCRIGEIGDELPIDFPEEDKPTLEQIDEFRDCLRIELEKKGIFRAVELYSPEAEYEVVGGILDYKKGSGAARFLIGLGVGNAKLTATLKLQDRNTGKILFAGNFTQEVSSGLETGGMTFDRAASDFAKALDKQIKKLKKKEKD